MRLFICIIAILCFFFNMFSGSVGYGGTKFNAYRDIVYVSNVRDVSQQSLDIFAPKKGHNLPVVIFFHGGSWSIGDKSNKSIINKRNFFVNNGMVFISANYRLAPKYQFPDYPEDVAEAISFIIDNIDQYNGDPNNIFLFGHSSGAHLIALTSTDDHYLMKYGKELRDIKGTILLDGAVYDASKVFDALENGEGNIVMRNIYETAFGTDPSIWEDASPITHVAENKGIPPFLVFYVKSRKESEIQSMAFTAALENAKIPVLLIPIRITSHRNINVSFGKLLGLKERTTLDFIERYSKTSLQ